MILKNLLDVIPSSTILHVTNQRDAVEVTKAVSAFLYNDKDVYNRKVVQVTPNALAINVLTE